MSADSTETPWNDAAAQITEIAFEVSAEVAAAEAKFAPFNSAHEGWAVIKEEMDELWAEVCKGGSVPKDPVAMRKEAVQLAAMAVRFIRDVCDGRNDSRPLSRTDLGAPE